MERITAMIEASTQDLNDETVHMTADIGQNKHVTE
jgi:hypothetical protein